MANNFSSSAGSWQSSHIESLNQVIDSVSVLSDAELQKELAIFTNAEFVYDIAPGTALDENEKKDSKRNNNSNSLHSLLNVKLASLAENNYHTYMSHDDINRFYDNETPDCTPPNGYYSPNPTPPNGIYSPNPTPPNGYQLAPNGFQGVINPPIHFYDDVVAIEDNDELKRLFSSIKKKEGNDEEEVEKVKRSSPNAPPLSKEDKRRRNTAASARFRVKKKLREQALQKTADEMTEKAKMFEDRVHELEREVQWLKALIVEKNDGKIEQMLNMQTYDSSPSSMFMGFNHQ